MNYTNTNSCWAILLAAGNGSRLADAANGTPKQFLTWRGAPLYWASAQALYACPLVRGIVFVFPESHCEAEIQRLATLWETSNAKPWRVVAGGQTRQESVFNGLRQVPQLCGKILVHDSARPFLKPELVARVCGVLAAENTHCVVPAIPVTDTIKLANPDNSLLIEATLPRDRLWAAQTPQGFGAHALRHAHDEARKNNLQATDDASLLEAAGYQTRICMGDKTNIKITSPEDLKLLEEKTQPAPRVGYGYDVHKYGPGRPLKLGGVAVPGGFEVIAHSDGDVLLHALMDAICGCAGMGDIGALFPDSDPRLEGVSSAILLDETMTLARNAGIKIVNADLTIVAQKPKISTLRHEIRRNVARLLAIPEECVNIKATTEEGLGFTGNLEGIKACAIVCAEKWI